MNTTMDYIDREERRIIPKRCSPQDVPTWDCTCGIYASSPRPDNAIKYLSTSGRILLLIQAIGKTIISEGYPYDYRKEASGWRSKDAKILAMIAPSIDDVMQIVGHYNHMSEIIFEQNIEMTYDISSLIQLAVIDMQSAKAMVESSWSEWKE